MRILIVCPAPPRSRKGNRVTATRWARLLRELGHRVAVATEYRGGRTDLLIALHARRSAPSVERYRRRRPRGPLVVALTGTDLYRDIRVSRRARHSLEVADRLVVLQPRALDELGATERVKAHVVYQSAVPPTRRPVKNPDVFD